MSLINTTMSGVASLEISEDKKHVRIFQETREGNAAQVCSFPLIVVWDYLKNILAATKYDEACFIRRHNEACETKAYHLKDKE